MASLRRNICCPKNSPSSFPVTFCIMLDNGAYWKRSAVGGHVNRGGRDMTDDIVKMQVGIPTPCIKAIARSSPPIRTQISIAAFYSAAAAAFAPNTSLAGSG